MKQSSFGVDLVKIKQVSMHICHLRAETNRKVWIANRTKFQGVNQVSKILGYKI